MATIRKLTKSLFVIYLFTIGAAAADVHCVQQSLLDLGFDPNGVDGALGNGTRAAAQAYSDVAQTNLPRLTHENVVIWCRSLDTAPKIRTEMRAICSESGKDVTQLAAYAGEWFSDDEPELPFGIFIEAHTEAGKIRGYYATPLHDGWYQSRSCVNFVGSVREDGALQFVTGNNGRIERVVPGFWEMNGAIVGYLADIEWNSRYGNTVGWARRFPASH